MGYLPRVLSNLISNIYRQNKDDQILLLSRFNSELDNLLDTNYFYKLLKSNTRIMYKNCPDAYIDCLTVHKSKGLGYDQVILLNTLDIYKEFPSKIEDFPVIKLLKRNMKLEEKYIQYPEERRLFYVTLTITKNKLYIMLPINFEYK